MIKNRRLIQSASFGAALTCLGGSVFAGEPGKLTREIWNNVEGGKVENLTVLPQFHGGADSVSTISGAEAPSNVANNYGSRLRGYIIAPVTGDYTFWESGDDAVELWMSETPSKFDAKKVAWHGGWTSKNQWDKYATQKSEAVRLTAGQKYYIELRHKEANGGDHLSLAWSYREVQPGVNLALEAGVVATQSTTYPGGAASNAIDGNTSGVTAEGDPISHTKNQDGSWWQVDLGTMRSIDQVVLWNRSSWRNRLSNFRVSLLDDDGTVMISKDFHTDGTHVGEKLEWCLCSAINAQTVKVELLGVTASGEKILALAEAQVFGQLSPQPVIDLAQQSGVTVSQSSTYPGGDADNALDTNTGGVTANGDKISHTRNIEGSWWQIDLGQEKTVERVLLWNRSTWQKRLANYRVSFIAADGSVVHAQDYHTNGTWTGATEDIVLSHAVRAQKIRVQKIAADAYGTNFICLAEVQVFGADDRLEVKPRELVDASALESYDIEPNDLDDDDLDDTWETLNGFDTSTWQDGIYAYDADSDRDYMSNAEEAKRGIEAFIPNSVQGTLTLEQWYGVPYYSIHEAAQESDHVYEQADHIEFTNASTTGEHVRWNMAQRMRGYIIAPETGSYRFWVSGTNGVQLSISTGEDKYSKRVIAEMGPELGTGHGMHINDSNKWDRFVCQMSEEVQLVAGQKYFIEVLQQHGHGHYPHADLAWARPGQEREEIPAEYLYSYHHIAADEDDDSLPDAWETAKGLSATDNGLLDRAREGENGDFDNDGLNNRAEYLAGTDPCNADTDGDGISDGQEVNSHGTDPLQSDAPVETIAGTVDVTTFTDSEYGWNYVDGGLISDTFRGEISWNVNIPTTGSWIIQVDTRLRGTVYANETVHVNASIDGTPVGRYAITYGASHNGIMRVLTPNISAGTHNLTLEIDNLLGRRTVQIDSITVRQPSGADYDGDNIPDWVENQLAAVDYVTPHGTSSRTSPAFIEGGARIIDGLFLNGNAVLPSTDSEHWYANLPLTNGEDTSYTAAFANGQQVQGDIYWWATNVLDNESLVIRQGDTLRLGCWVGGGPGANTEHPNNRQSTGNGVVSTLTVEGQSTTLGNSKDVLLHQFNTPGVYTVDASHVTGATGTLSVTVVGAQLPDDTTIVQNSVSYLDLTDAQADRNLFFETGKGLNLVSIEDIDTDNYRMRLDPANGGHYGLVARLYAGGPIVDIGDVTSVTVTDALQNGLDQTYATQNYPGYYLLTTPMVVQDLPPGGKVVVTIFRNGVMFPDGTKEMTFYYEDLVDGLVYLQFLLPEGQNGGYCHNVSVYDADGKLLNKR
ncbi:PA14 domain-containing protein [Rubritalea squalenifaciens DSM 18772]|uniref:PA14 domain-containing protein n=1 Tax=Rubritalea squalenifaciens DSM 18772 TaxID=1123071 RepID=A0A1M6RI13_9BACT|nr:PA14 domain-containing protein [Rubritalea squalenifaciens]SHK32018.1 PA14 domain-containing protein [Rubritalea squalenifaciens DSM 18772]